MKQGYEAIEKRRDNIGKDVNGWMVGAAFGDRAFCKGDYELRAAAAPAGIYGNDAAEAMYPFAKTDNTGATLDGSKHRYTLTFAKDQLPPVNAFWSVTMYDGKTQLLIDNPIKAENWRGKAFYAILFMFRQPNGGGIGNYFNSLSNALPAPNDEMDARFRALNAARGRRLTAVRERALPNHRTRSNQSEPAIRERPLVAGGSCRRNRRHFADVQGSFIDQPAWSAQFRELALICRSQAAGHRRLTTRFIAEARLRHALWCNGTAYCAIFRRFASV